MEKRLRKKGKYPWKTLKEQTIDLEMKSWMTDALTKLDILECEHLPTEDAIANMHVFTPEFEKKMEKLFASDTD